MSYLIRMPRAAWRRQPQGPVEINRRNLITTQLSVLLPLRDRTDVTNLVTQEVATVTAGVSNATYTGGRSLYLSAAADCIDFVNPASITSGTQPLTIAWIQQPINPTAFSNVISWKPTGATYAFSITQMASDGDSNYNFVIGPAALDYTKMARFSDSIGAMANRRIDRFVAVIPGGTADCSATRLWRNGIEITRNTSTANNNFGVNTNALARIGSNYSNTNSFDGLIHQFAIWGRALADSEARSVSENPYQIIAPRPSRFILIPDGAVGGSFSSTSLLDALIQKTFSSTTTLDALIQSAFNSSISLDSLISAVKNNTITFDALLQSTKNSTISVDALLQSVKSGSVSIDALIQLTLSRMISIDAFIQSTSNKVTSLDSLIQATKNGSISFDALITGATGTFANLSIDALIQAVKNQTISVDALIRKEYSSTIALDAYIALVGTRTVSLDSLIQLTKNGAISIDALIQMSKNNFVSFDALIQSAKSGMISLDAILTLATNVSVFLDAYVQKTLSRGVSLDAIIGAIADMIMPVGRVISVNQSNRLVSISNSERMISIQ